MIRDLCIFEVIF